jgi:hypothetical protein
MIVLYESGYTLRQIPGRKVVYITVPKGWTEIVYCEKLTKENAKACILAIGK